MVEFNASNFLAEFNFIDTSRILYLDKEDHNIKGMSYA
jgi:hypothetical protein